MSNLIGHQEQSRGVYYFARCSMSGVGSPAERLNEAMTRRGVSQSALARAIGTTQGAISLILRGKTANSRLLPKIALQLDVPLPWLLGTSDAEIASGSTTADLEPQQIVLPVTLPSRVALARMFEGMLRELPPELEMSAQAQLLAKWLPIALSQARDLLPIVSTVSADGPEAERELAEALSTQDRGSRS